MSVTGDLGTQMPVRQPGYAVTATPDGGLLTHDGRQVAVLNDTATAFWELCDGRTSIAEMSTAAAALFDADESTIEQGLEQAFDRLAQHGAVRWSSGQ